MESIIKAMGQALTRLLETMRQEAQALATPGTPNVESILQQKATLLETVSELEQSRQDFCTEAGLDPAPEQMLTQLSPAGTQTKVAQTWDQVLHLLDGCQQQNLTNGAILQLRQRFTLGALGILRGAGTDGVYSENGSVDAYTSRNTRFLSA